MARMVQCLEASEPRQTRQRRTRAPTPNQAGPSQETNTGPISSSTSLQPNQSSKVVLRQPRRTLPSWTIVDTASKLGHNIWTYDPSQRSHPTPTQPRTRPHGDRRGFWARQFTGTLGPSDPLSYQHRCQDLCFPLGFVLTLEATRCTQLRLGVQNLASSGAGMVASGNGLTCHVIP
jgi:hypothetical protein